jgi:GNAT superfamily N-acetyltransferase
MCPKIEIRPVKESEYKFTDLCINRSFSSDLNHVTRQGFFNEFRFAPWESHEFYWAVFVDGKPVSGLMLIPFQLMIDYTPIQVVGLTGVGTDPDYRHKGYAGLLLDTVHSYFKNLGFDGAVLHSAADKLYHLHGYEFVFCLWQAKLPIKALRNLITINKDSLVISEDCKVEFYSALDFNRDICAELMKIRNLSPQFVNRRVKALRTVNYYYSKMLENFEKGTILGVLYSKGQPQAYIIAQIDGMINELISRSADFMDLLLLLHATLNEFPEDIDTKIGHLTMKLYSEDEPLLKICSLCGSGSEPYRINMPKNMATFFDPNEMMKKMQTTFSIRYSNFLSSNQCKNNPITAPIPFQFIFKINLLDGKGVYEYIFHVFRTIISIEPLSSLHSKKEEQLPHIEINFDEWMALMFGYITIDDLDIDDQIDSKKVKPLLEILFPALEPVWDNFANF